MPGPSGHSPAGARTGSAPGAGETYGWSRVGPSSGAGDGTRTRDIQLGRLELYQLSYSRSNQSLTRDSKGRRLRIQTGAPQLPGFGPDDRMVEGGGFEPPKASPTDLQSVPFDRSGTPPHRPGGRPPASMTGAVRRPGLQDHRDDGAGEGTRTPNHLITNEMLYQLSYASTISYAPARVRAPYRVRNRVTVTVRRQVS